MFHLLIVFGTISFICGLETPYNLKSVTAPILQEELFKAKLNYEVWTTVHFVEISDLDKKASMLNVKIQNLRCQCMEVDFCVHATSIETMFNKFYKIKSKIRSVHSLSSNKRQKRGLFNIVGTINKYLRGTMSADDAERINQQIDAVYNNTANIAIHLSNQTAIIKNSLRKLQDISSSYKKNMKILEETANNIVSKTLKNAFNANMMECITDLEIHIDELLENVNLILDSIFDGKLGIASPRLITPKNFIHGLETIQSKLSYQDLPFPLLESSYLVYMTISKINILLAGDKLIYVINTPIPSRTDYIVYKFIPVPMSGWSKYYMFDSISNQPVAVDSNFNEYSVIDLSKCVAVNDFRVCEITFVVHRFSLEESCYARLIKDKNDKGCSRKYFNLEADFVLTLSNGYSWYILPTKEENILITCGLSTDVSVNIQKPSILELNSNCRGHSKNHKYLPKTHLNNTKIREYKIALQFLPIEEIALNTTDLKLPTFTSFHADTSEILKSAKTIDDMTKDLEIITTNHNYHKWMFTGYHTFHYGMYTIATVAILYLLYRLKVFHCIYQCYKCCPLNRLRSHSNNQQNRPQNVEEIQVNETIQNIEAHTNNLPNVIRSVIHYVPNAPSSQ